MADPKTKTSPGGGPPRKGVRVGVLELPPEEPDEKRVETGTSPPGGKLPPPPPNKRSYGLQTPDPNQIVQLYGGPRDGEITTLSLGIHYQSQGKGYGYVEVQERRPAAQPQTQMKRQQTNALARTTTRTISQQSQPDPEFLPQDQKRIELYQTISKALPEDTDAQILKQQAEEEAYKNKAEAAGPIPKEQVSVLKKLYKQFRDFYYEGVAEHVQSLKNESYRDALRSQETQLSAMRNGMSSLTNLHQGLDLATWNFFFNSLGPFGELLRKYHDQKNSFNMAYHGGRSPLSPNYIDYVISELPKEKALDIVIDASSNLLYFVGKKTGFGLFSKPFDMYGKPVESAKPVFTPLLKFQEKVNTTTAFFEALGTENSVKPLYKELDSIENQLYWFDPKHESINAWAELRNNKISLLEKISREEGKYKKRFFLGLLPPGGLSKKETLDTFRAKLFRTLLPRKFLRKVREPKGDILSWLAAIIGQYLFEVTIGNIVRAIVEKLAGSEVWIKTSQAISRFMERSSTLRTLRYSFSTTKEFLSAGPSLNTLSGGYLGYTVGGEVGKLIAKTFGLNPAIGQLLGQSIGAPVGAGFGWGYQWVLNMSNNQTLMGWVTKYQALETEIAMQNRVMQRFIDKGKGVNDPTVLRCKDEIQNLINTRNAYLKTYLGSPGNLQRFANWLSNPHGWGRFFRIPLKGIAVSSIIEQLQLAGLELPWWYESWMPPTAQYFWEIKGALFDKLTGFLRGGLSWSWQKIAFNRVMSVTITDVQLQAFREYMAADRAIIRVSSKIGTDAMGRPLFRVTIGTYNSLFSQLNGFYRTVFRTPLSTLQRISTAFSRTGLSRFLRGWWGNILNPGFFIGMELAGLMGWPLWTYLPAGMAGGAMYAAAVWGAQAIMRFGFGMKFVGGFSGLLSRVSLGGFIGWGVGTVIEAVWGIPNAGLWGTIIGSLASFALTYIAISVIGWAGTWASAILGIGTTIGSFVVGVVTGVLGSVGITVSFAGLVVAGSVAIVAVLTVFTVIIVGSAFWIPFSERLEGVTSSSMCFDISQPTFNGIPQSTFAKNERKEVCWKTINKTEFYQDAIEKNKALSPMKDFTFHGYKFSVTTPDGKTVLFEGNANVSGKQQDGYLFDFLKQATRSGPGFVEYTFKLTPPKDTTGGYSKILLKQFEEHAKNIAQGNVSDYEENSKKLIALTVVQGAHNSAIRLYLVDEQIKLLESIKKTPPSSQDELNKLIDEEKIRLKNKINSGYKDHITGQIGQLSGDLISTQKIINDCAGKTDPLCTSIDSYSLPSGLIGAVDSMFNPYKSISPEDIDQEIKTLKTTKKQIDRAIDEIKPTTDRIHQINSLLHSYGYNTDDFKKELEKYAKSESSGIELYYLPVNTVIKTCLDVTYTGNGTTASSVRETDSAVVPLLGQLVTTSSCQAELITPINQRGPASIINPVPGSTISQGYQHGDGGHDGVDFAAPAGTNVLAAASGTVISTGINNMPEVNGFGRYLIIQGDDGFYYLYAHMGSKVDPNVPYYAPGIAVGTKVNAGDVIGYVGNTGKVTGPHLHFAISTSPDISSFYNKDEATTIDPCLFIVGGCR